MRANSKEVWAKYVAELFESNSPPFRSQDLSEPAPGILHSEVRKALSEIKTRKASGPDDICPDILKLIEDENIHILVQLFNDIYNSGYIPRDWLKSTFIPIPKKPGARKCAEFRLISLMSQVLKVFLKIIHRRIRRKCEQDVSELQMGFRDGLGTREALFALSVLLQKCRDQQREVYLCFIDYTKAFDCVDHTTLLELLQRKGVDAQDLKIVQNLYEQQVASVKLENTETSIVPIGRGVRQGCVLSPMLFNMYSEVIFQNALDETEEGLKVNGKLVNNLRYADDTVIIADSPEGLQRLIDSILTSGDAMGLRINISKTKIMQISRNQNNNFNINIYGSPIEQVTKFKYLGSWICEDLNPEIEIRSRIEQARANFIKMRNLLTDRTLNLNIRFNFVRCYVHSTLLYGVEAWTLKVSSINKLEAFEMWVYRRMLRIPWTDHITNQEVLHRMNKDRTILETIKKRKTAYLGHVMRQDKYRFLQLIMEGKIEGKRGPGRRQCSWLKNLRDWTGLDSNSLLRRAQDRDEFARIVADLH